MNPTTTEAGFDCIAFKREAQIRIYEAIRSMTPEEQIAYFREQAETGPLGEWWKGLPPALNAQAAPSSSG